MTIRQLRQNYKKRRNEIPKEKREILSLQLCGRLHRILTEQLPYKTVLMFYPLGSEVNLLPLAEELLKEQYELYFPVTGKDGIFFYKVSSLEDFQEGAFHVMEPVTRQKLYETGAAVSLTPGLLFTMSGSRIGYGGGYYDRYLARVKDYPVYKIAAVYEKQVLDKVPVGRDDIRLDTYITEAPLLPTE
jgi:5-formyltetrahydrofolate cyclo-ligase